MSQATEAEPADTIPPDPPAVGLDRAEPEPVPPDPIDFAEFDLRAREWWDRFASFVQYRLPVTELKMGGQLSTRDGVSPAVDRAEDAAVIECLGAMRAMAKRYNPEPTPMFTLDVSRIGRG